VLLLYRHKGGKKKPFDTDERERKDEVGWSFKIRRRALKKEDYKRKEALPFPGG